MSTVPRVERILNAGILGYRPVRFDMALDAASKEVLGAVWPPPVVLPERGPDLQYALGEELLLSPYQGKWDSLLAAADGRQTPRHWCPIHMQSQCEQFWPVRRGVVHCCSRGHVGHPAAAAGALASSTVLQMWLPPPEPPL